jgi:protein TonB
MVSAARYREPSGGASPTPKQRPRPNPIAADDPLAKVLALGRREARIGALLGLFGALVLHGGAGARAVLSLLELGAFASATRAFVVEQLHATYDVEMLKQPEPPPREPPPPEPEPEQVKQAAPAEQAPPPAPAEAGKVLTAEPDPNEPVDLTDQGFLSGESTRFAGGVTAAAGKSKTAVRDLHASEAGVVGGTGTAPAPPPARDLSKPASPLSTEWNCGFPPEADAEQIDFGLVRLAVTVGADGHARDVSVLQDPGHGFGRLARQCAYRMSYAVGQDSAGKPAVRTTAPFNVRFTR